ncbi:hypothetical protein HMPREF9455_02741 [Dysgonomonas gadei ATCC BAA-286]|uniref:Uncharacterized protein n=1 Tax=Dysgonomonas gadei ATCC BAA-286 TaxID=742766 RepID=F5J074_9BACT|nr:hypothetical protein HMPREF9455_02741 [Dysgonomonas gadei ATCC BAA-286]
MLKPDTSDIFFIIFYSVIFAFINHSWLNLFTSRVTKIYTTIGHRSVAYVKNTFFSKQLAVNQLVTRNCPQGEEITFAEAKARQTCNFFQKVTKVTHISVNSQQLAVNNRTPFILIVSPPRARAVKFSTLFCYFLLSF